MAQSTLPTRKPAGFSLVEIVVTMLILSVLVSMVALAFRGSLDHSHLQNAADRFAADLRLVRDQARRDQQSYTLLIIPAILTYRAPGVSMLHSPADIAVCLAESPYKITELSLAGIQDATTITFDSHGRANPAGTIDLILGPQKIGVQISEGGKIEQIH
jgi:prepilin-type N-terminal cleavage/methylation domain-containing protein